MALEMNSVSLKKLCIENKLYTTPHINDKLYLHYKGFSKIQNLEEFTGLKALWLEGNGFNKIEGLEKQTLMRSLYLHENVLDKIEGLDTLVELDTLNLSKNFISKIVKLLFGFSLLFSFNICLLKFFQNMIFCLFPEVICLTFQIVAFVSLS